MSVHTYTPLSHNFVYLVQKGLSMVLHCESVCPYNYFLIEEIFPFQKKVEMMTEGKHIK